jgi:hypothetical protein
MIENPSAKKFSRQSLKLVEDFTMAPSAIAQVRVRYCAVDKVFTIVLQVCLDPTVARIYTELEGSKTRPMDSLKSLVVSCDALKSSVQLQLLAIS